ncbi:MAG TPA: hypothetical protein VMN82_15750 [Thermoanaerobaculia bacterium]|nr:hypothetical protein [Thermoanaerobaculia bacterium]
MSVVAAHRPNGIVGRRILVGFAIGALAVLTAAADFFERGLPKDTPTAPWTIGAICLVLAAWIGSIHVWWRAGDRGLGHWGVLPLLVVAGAVIGPLVILGNVGWFGRPDVFAEAVPSLGT